MSENDGPVLQSTWYRPPQIKPNYGRRKPLLPKSQVTQVLLHDNATQKLMLKTKLKCISSEHVRMNRILEMNRKAFLVQQSLRQQHLRDMGITHISYLPEATVEHYGRQRRWSTRDHTSSAKTTTASSAPIAHARERTRSCVTLYGGVRDNNVSGGGGDGSAVAARPRAHTHAYHYSSENSSRRASTAAGHMARPHTMFPTVIHSSSDKPRPGHMMSRSSTSILGTGMTTKFTTFDDSSGKQSAAIKVVKVRGPSHCGDATADSTNDSRYLQLRQSLVPNAYDFNGFIELSPSGHKVLQQYAVAPTRWEEVFEQSKFDFNKCESSSKRKQSKDETDRKKTRLHGPGLFARRPKPQVQRLIVHSDYTSDTYADSRSDPTVDDDIP